MTPVLAVGFEVDNNVILGALLVGLILFASGLIGAMGVIKGWIREVAGVKDTTTTEISGQPIRFTEELKFITKTEHTEHCGNMDRRVGVLENDIKMIRHKMESDKTEIIAAGEDRSIKIHDRINVAIEKIGELRGEVNRIAKV